MPLMEIRLPVRRLTQRLLRRGLMTWAVPRLILFAIQVFMVGDPPGSAILLTPAAAVALVAAASLLGWVATVANHEHRFLANLGVSPLAMTILLSGPALLAELLLGIATLP